MIIRNGYIRNDEGHWINLSDIHRFWIETLFPHQEAITYQIKADIKGCGEEWDEESFGCESYDLDALQCELDDAFGFTG